MTTKNRERRKARCQRPSLLDEVLERRMLLYVLAAGATLAGASGAAQAKVVFTPSNAVVSSNNHLDIDMNNDGTTDFVIRAFTAYCSKCGCESFLNASASGTSNGLETIQTGRLAALRNGAEVPNLAASPAFTKRGSMAGEELVSYYCEQYSFGPFANTTNRFLGVKLIVDGETHYGWIGFRQVYAGYAQLLGWAYETQPNTPIIAGSGQGAVFPPSSEMRPGGPKNARAARAAKPTSLELLAAGHIAVADWRRRNAAVISSASPS